MDLTRLPIARAKAIEEWKKVNGEPEETSEMDYDQELTPANVFVVPGKEEIESLLLEKRKAVRDLPIFIMMSTSDPRIACRNCSVGMLHDTRKSCRRKWVCLEMT